MNTDIEKLKYPIGKFTFKEIEGNAYLDLIDRLADLPNKLRLAVSNLDDVPTIADPVKMNFLELL